MKLKTLAIAALLVVSATTAVAQRVKTYISAFEPIASGDLVALGFGRGGDVISPTPSASARFAPASFSTLSAAIPGTLPYTFRDVWKFNGLAAGTYSVDTTINAFTNTTFGLVQFIWSDNDTLGSFDFEIAPNMKSAHGVGTFTVGADCIVKYCVNVQIYGWDDGLDVPGSGYGPQTTFGVSVVPEPATGAMLLAGLGALGWLARRRRA